MIEAYAGGVLYDHTGQQHYGDVPSTHWAWAHWEEIVTENWHSSGFAVGADAFPDSYVSVGELVLLGEVITGRPFEGGIHLATAVDLCWVTAEEANSPADSVTTERGLAILAVIGEGTACGLPDSTVNSLVDDLLDVLGQ